jgi:hypothetical protein
MALGLWNHLYDNPWNNYLNKGENMTIFFAITTVVFFTLYLFQRSKVLKEQNDAEYERKIVNMIIKNLIDEANQYKTGFDTAVKLIPNRAKDGKFAKRGEK